jgi:hypothetical protein
VGAGRRSADRRGNTTRRERRARPSSMHGKERKDVTTAVSARSVGRAKGVDRVRALHRVFYRCAQRDRDRRLQALYAKVARSDGFWRAWGEVRAHRGAPGVDGITIDDVVAPGWATSSIRSPSRCAPGTRYAPVLTAAGVIGLAPRDHVVAKAACARAGVWIAARQHGAASRCRRSWATTGSSRRPRRCRQMLPSPLSLRQGARASRAQPTSEEGDLGDLRRESRPRSSITRLSNPPGFAPSRSA